MAEGPEYGHQFHFSVAVQGSYSVVGEPGYKDEADPGPERFTLTVRAWNLRDACAAASRAPLTSWTWPTEDPDEAPSDTDPTP